jgi:hypothetical protein
VRRTTAPLLIVAVLLGAVVGWLLQIALAASGSATFTPTATLWAALFAIAVIVIVLGVPVRSTVRGKRERAVDPFYAMRVLVLAKASSLTGALLAGFAAALVVYALTRAGVPVTPAFVPDVVTVIAALALLIAGLVVESWCRIPPEDHQELPSREAERR